MTAGSAPAAIGVDVGGTKVAALRVRPDGDVLAREIVPTPADDGEATLEAMARAAAAVHTPDVVAVGVGAAGMVDHATGVLVYAPNIAWRDVALGHVLRSALGVPASVDNDCTTAAYGEWRLGAGRGVDDMLYVGLGTGVGGGIVSGGRLVRGAHGFAAEIGHIVVQPDGELCGCGNRGCWETVASGTAVGLQGRRAVARHPHSTIGERVKGDADAVTGVVVSEAARDGDVVARGILAEVGHRLGEGIAGLVNVLDPALVVVGGGAAQIGDLLLDPARTAFRMTVEARDRRPEVPIVEAALGPDGAAIGAALLALDEVST
jgi:glucokinase